MGENKKFIIVLYGPSCGGKTSVVELLISRNKNIFRASPDKIKWLISNYNWKHHSDVVYRLLVKLSQGAASEGFSIVCEGSIQAMKNKSRDFRLIAKRNKMAFFEFNIIAPFDAVKERFKERIKNSKLKGWKISNKSHKRFKELYNLNKKHEDGKIPSFDSSILSTKKIVKEIEKIVFSSD